MNAQTIIDGYISGSKDKLEDVFVVARKSGSNSILAYSDSNSDGYYKIIFNSEVDSIVLAVTGISVENQEKTVKNMTQRVDFSLVEKSREIREVVVKVKRIEQEGDTINYNVVAFKKQDDRVISDVLKRMPGIEVADNGHITYNGKAISNFYVEDMDLLQGRYGVAVNNINANDVSKVQVLENHEPVKMMKDRSISDKVAINLKLKESAKGTIAVNAMIGGGCQHKGIVVAHFYGVEKLQECIFQRNVKILVYIKEIIMEMTFLRI